VKLALAEHNCEQVELKAILSFLLLSVIFNILALLKIKEHHSSFCNQSPHFPQKNSKSEVQKKFCGTLGRISRHTG